MKIVCWFGLSRREDDPEDPLALKFVSVVRLQFRSGEDNCWFGLARSEDDPEDPMALKFVSVVRLQFRSVEFRVCGKTFFRKKAVLGIGNQIRRIRMFSSLADPSRFS
jgi:hypothetical protein